MDETKRRIKERRRVEDLLFFMLKKVKKVLILLINSDKMDYVWLAKICKVADTQG